MTCICQYLTASQLSGSGLDDDNQSIAKIEQLQATLNQKDGSPSDKDDISVTEMIAAHAEIWLLKKKLNESEITIRNLELLLRTVMKPQNAIKNELYELKQQHMDFQKEFTMQYDYHVMERKQMLKELSDVRSRCSAGQKLLNETLKKNEQLKADLLEANEKIILIGTQLLSIKMAHKEKMKKEKTLSMSSLSTTSSQPSLVKFAKKLYKPSKIVIRDTFTNDSDSNHSVNRHISQSDYSSD